MRYLFVVLFSISTLFGANIERNINKTKNSISATAKKQKSLNSNLGVIVKKIQKEERALTKLNTQYDTLAKELKDKETLYENYLKNVELLKANQGNLEKTKEDIRRKLIFLVAKNLSVTHLLDEEEIKDPDALITKEALQGLKKLTKTKIEQLNSEFIGINSKIDNVKNRLTNLKKSIARIDNKKENLKKLVQKQEVALKSLKEKKLDYLSSLDKILKRKSNLRKELNKLYVLKKEEKKRKVEQERRERAERERIARIKKELALKKKEREVARKKREAQEKKREKEEAQLAQEELPEVRRRYSNNYQNIQTKRYRGKKTIAPLASYSVTKKFGLYTDPIYKIKIFNESVSLKPKQKNAKVKNVLNGKVVLVKETALLDNVVVVQHRGGLHTIYAQLDKVAPSIKSGKKLKKGSIIGRVSRELIFEVTQKNSYINPLELIN